MSRTRREFLATAALAAGALPLVGACTPERAPRDHAGADGRRIFRHGVASGDPRSDRVILWTRVTAVEPSLPVRWTVASDPGVTRVIARGDAAADAARDHTVKVDAGGLDPATTYYYRFEALGEASPVGRTRTLPGRDAAGLRLAVVSCANYPVGFFNVYARVAARADLDAVVHLGDYIYEYGERREDGGREKGRLPRPLHELVSLADYRARLAQYREDPDLQEAHRQHPWIAVWDDHEFANDSWPGGAATHQPDTEGEWATRRDAGARAFLEWLPIREGPASSPRRVHRTFRAGTLCDLVMLDTRMAGRAAPAASLKDIATLEAPSRSLLGAEQEAWLEGELAASARDGVRWPVLGQQIMFAPQVPRGQATFNEDSWDGYRAAQARLFDAVEGLRLPNFAVLTGDVHSSWGYDLAPRVFETGGYDPATGRGSVGVELVAPAVSSSNSFGAPDVREQRVQSILAARPHLRYLEGERRGYLVVDLTPARLQAEWWLVPTVTEKTDAEACDRAMVCEAGTRHLATVETVVARARDVAPAP